MPTPIACARTSSSLSLGCGNGTSTASSTCGGPGCRNWITLMARRLHCSQTDPRQLVLVVVQVQQPGSRNGRKLLHALDVGRALEFDRAGKAADGAGLE